MKKLLYNSVVLLVLVACGTSEDSVKNNVQNLDSLTVFTDTISKTDSLTVDLPLDDSTRAITHGSPNQEELDSIKRAKLEEKKKK